MMELPQHYQAVLSTPEAETVSSTSGISDVTVKALRQPEGF